ncbi:MAG TPA: tripartite tricarboxylate transporter substrate binding protein [Burkholderiales bacterium]|nr:tripartite tricarboxylate transporter substrate binding protein [Burkholderiales bacterium]
MNTIVRACVPALALLAVALDSHAQDTAAGFPSRVIRLVIPFSPGGGTDIVGRMVAQKLTESWGQQMIVDNRAGANGIIGADLVAKSAPDGYTICMFTASHSVNVSLQGVKQPYDLQRDFAPISLLAVQPYVLVVNPRVPARSVAELVALAKAKPGAIAFGSSGVGGLVHLSAELFAALANIRITHVPYKGGALAMMDVVAGNVDMMFTSLNQSNQLIDAGRLRLLAVTTTRRSPAVPDIPTMQEAGVKGYAVESWYGLAAPAAVPAAIIDKYNREINRILKLPDVAERMATDGATPAGGTPVQFGAYLRSEVDKWRRTIKASGITPGK